MRQITKDDWVRFVFSNHSIFNTKEALHSIMHSVNITLDELKPSLEPWFETNNWWDDSKFIETLKEVGVVFPQEILIRKQLK
jgi:hypothetical protein